MKHKKNKKQYKQGPKREKQKKMHKYLFSWPWPNCCQDEEKTKKIKIKPSKHDN